MEFPLRGGILIFFYCRVKCILFNFCKNYPKLGVYNKHSGAVLHFMAVYVRICA